MQRRRSSVRLQTQGRLKVACASSCTGSKIPVNCLGLAWFRRRRLTEARHHGKRSSTSAPYGTYGRGGGIADRSGEKHSGTPHWSECNERSRCSSGSDGYSGCSDSQHSDYSNGSHFQGLSRPACDYREDLFHAGSNGDIHPQCGTIDRGIRRAPSPS